ncbi:25893_t:CDS:2, partial [Racocetra persica]
MNSPTAWNLNDKSAFLRVDSEGLRASYEGLGETDEECVTIRANNSIPPQCILFYFEIEILDGGKDG